MKPARTQVTARLQKLGLLTISIAVGGTVMGGPAPPRTRPYRAQVAPGRGPLRVLPPGRSLLPAPADRFVVVAPPGIDDGMIVPAPTGIDEGMIFPARQRISEAAPVPALPLR